MTEDYWTDPEAPPGQPPTPMLNRLVRKRIVGVYHQENGRFRIVEHCDGHFEDEFTAGQLVELAGELLALAVYAYGRSE